MAEQPNWRLAWLGFDRLRTADSGEWLDALGILERAGYADACAKGKWASQSDGTARLTADYLPSIDVVFVDGEPWKLVVSQTCDLEGNPLGKAR